MLSMVLADFSLSSSGTDSLPVQTNGSTGRKELLMIKG